MKLKNKNFIILLIIVIVFLIELINPFELILLNKLEKINYSPYSSRKILEYGLKDEILRDGYIEFIDKNIFLENFDINNYNVYKEIEINSGYNNIDVINDLINKKYNAEEINCILKKDINSIDNLLSKTKYDNIVEYLKYDYSKLSNLDRYVSYKNKKMVDYEDSVVQVEIGLDKEFYSEYETINEFSIDMLVNKYNRLADDFNVSNLVKINDKYSFSKNMYGNKIMLDNFYKMADDLNKELGLKIYVRSAYRTYKNQELTYNNYLKNKGKSYVEKYVAYPGFSEHQTGLAIDIKASSGNIFEKTKEAKWVYDNAYKYGFIERYTELGESLTGYESEKWHYRYVGLDIAKYIHENNITFDEYYIKFIK